MPRPVVHLDTELPRTLAVGRGTCLFVSGSWEARGRRVSDPRLLLDGSAQTPVLTGIPIRGADRDSGFCGILAVSPVERPRRAALELEASIEGAARERQSLGEIELVPALARPEGSPPPGSGNGPLVAICMASFDPDPGLLERQIASIREQAHGAWVCLISDDHSSEARFGDLRSLTAGDSALRASRARSSSSASTAISSERSRWSPTTPRSSPSPTRTTVGTRRSSPSSWRGAATPGSSTATCAWSTRAAARYPTPSGRAGAITTPTSPRYCSRTP